MAEIQWAILCQQGIVDRFTNNLSIIGVVNEVTFDKVREDGAGASSDEAEAEYGMALGCQLVTLWARSDPDQAEKFWQRVTITTPDGREHAAPGDRLLGDLVDHKRTRLLTGIRTIPYGGTGIYTFNVLYAENEADEGEIVSRAPVEIKVREVDTAR